ncbi:hypothetical protein BD560DRAFT_409339 [Blakeslea trispora]|nr:hypothetical protein BD560DRAFT_409339 [Blakeslea trispora]
MSRNTTIIKEIKNIENININVNELKRAHSEDSASSCSTFSDGGVKRKRKLDYLKGEGVEEWTPQSKLMLGDFDVNAFLCRYRKRNIKLAKKTNDLSDMKILSLSHLFPLDKFDEEKCITKHFDEKTRASMLEIQYKEVKLPKASAKAVMYCKAFSDGDEDDFEAINELEKKMKACCNILKEKKKLAVQKNSETSFMMKYLLPYLEEIFMVNPNKYSIFATVDGVEDHGFIPDWKLGFAKHKKKALFCFFVEVKRPGESSRYQKETDYVKLLKEMKSSIDKQINMGLASLFSFGLLVEGFRCTLYMMRIEEEGVYMPKTIKRFSLLQDIEDAVNVPAMVEGLMFVKEYLAKLEPMYNNYDRKKPLKRMMKNTFLTEFK